MQTFNLSALLHYGEERELTAEEVTRPREMVFSFGNGLCSRSEDEEGIFWKQCLEGFRGFYATENVQVEEVDADQYLQLLDYRSLFCRFGYGIPYDSFRQAMELGDRTGSQIAYVSELGYSDGSPDSIFVYDGVNRRCYRFFGDHAAANFDEIIRSAEGQGLPAYYAASTLFGVNNSTLIPMAGTGAPKRTACSAEMQEKGAEGAKNLAEKFFGVDFGFVRRIEESQGNLVYMYGYGQRTLTFSADGAVEYSEELSTDASGRADYFAALQTALAFIENYGGWKDGPGRYLDLSVGDAREVERNRQKGYRFLFRLGAGSGDICGAEGALLETEVYGNQVTYYKRFLPSGPVEPEEAFGQIPCSVIDILSSRYEEMYGYLAQDLPGEEDPFSLVAGSLAYVGQGLMKQAGAPGDLLPVWVIRTESREFYFDLYTGEMLSAVNRAEY